MRFAIVDSKTLAVTNMCEWEGAEWLPPFGTFIVQSDTADRNDIYDPISHSFSRPEPTGNAPAEDGV